jgi:hypothetical protein
MLRRLKEIMKIKTKGEITYYLSHTLDYLSVAFPWQSSIEERTSEVKL